MGFFSKLSDNIHHGGVKVQLDAPGSASIQDPSLAVQVTVTATEPQNVEWVRVDLEAVREDIAMSSMGGVPQSQVNQQNMPQLVARAENAEPFSLAAGESKTIDLSITLNGGNKLAQQTQGNEAVSAVAKAFGALETFANTMDTSAYRYTLKAIANVTGITLDPSDSRGISINRPGQLGGTVNIKL